MSKLVIFLVAVSIFFPIILLLLQKPSNSKDFVSGMDKLPETNFVKQTVTVDNFRHWGYKNEKVTDFSYSSKAFNPNNINKVFFLKEPFSKFEGIAHTYFLFEFSNDENAAVSVEARREKGEDFSAILGLLKKYELMYIWGDGKDITNKRLLIEKNKVHKRPLKLTKTQAKKLFMQLSSSTKDLEHTPRFYNTLTDNCINVLVKIANKTYHNSTPLDKDG